MKLPRVSTFEYHGIQRVVIERKQDSRGCGLLCTQLVPEVATKTFKPGKMGDPKRLGVFKTLYYLARSARIEIG